MELPEELIKLTKYQQRYIKDTARIKVAKWCRQAGKDFITSLEAVMDALEYRRDWFIISLTQRQAEATAQKARMHCQAISGALPEITERVVERNAEFELKAFEIILPGGGRIVALPGRSPDTLAGLTGNVIFTEMALFPNKGLDHWRVVFPLITRGFLLRAISTPRGPDTKFAELCRNEQGKCSVHVVDIHQAVADGLELRDEAGNAITPEELRQIYNDEAGWQREYLVIEGEAERPLLEWRYIEAAGADCAILRCHIEGPEGLERQFGPDRERAFRELVRQAEGPVILGWDIAATGHLSTVTVGELLAGTLWLRGLITMHQVDDFDFQEGLVRLLLSAGAAGQGDKTGLGRASCNRLEKEFPGRFYGLMFSAISKARLGTGLMRWLQAGKFRCPRDLDELKHDIHAIRRDESGPDGLLRLSESTNPIRHESHCDMAWSLALLLDLAGELFADRKIDGCRLAPLASRAAGRPSLRQGPRDRPAAADERDFPAEPGFFEAGLEFF